MLSVANLQLLFFPPLAPTSSRSSRGGRVSPPPLFFSFRVVRLFAGLTLLLHSICLVSGIFLRLWLRSLIVPPVERHYPPTPLQHTSETKATTFFFFFSSVEKPYGKRHAKVLVARLEIPFYLLNPNLKLLRPGGRNRRQQLHQHHETLYRLRLRSGLVSCGHSPSRSPRKKRHFLLPPLLRKTSAFDLNRRRLFVRGPRFHPGLCLLLHVLPLGHVK